MKTDLVKYKQKQKRVPRYYSELDKLYQHLISTLDVLIPPLPMCPIPNTDKEGHLLGRQWWYTLTLPNEIRNETQQGRVEDRLQRWLDRITDHESIQSSEGLREFIESENGFRPNITKNRVLRHIPYTKDVNPVYVHWTDEFNQWTDYLVQLLSKVQKLSYEHSAMAEAWLDMSSALVSYGGLERNPSLFIIYKTIAKQHQQLYSIEKTQAISIYHTIGSEIRYQIRNSEAAENAVQKGCVAWSDYLASEKYVDSCHIAAERLKSSVHINRDKVNEAILILEDARRNKLKLEQHYERMDKQLHEDIEHKHKKNVSKDLLMSIHDYAKSQLFLEQKKLALYEEVLSSVF
ncbi:hypothetical protein BDB01DRAFT_793294 [Pilobolus umbonatus]|nr:hypothetical protein BDB01DRAFT_793294 [Pilobolus umbonatus]